jgi:hypothetical protein
MRHLAKICLLATLLGVLAPLGPAAAADRGPAYREIQFPVEGNVSFSDDFGDARSGGRVHEGNDLLGTKLQHELAAADATVVSARLDAGGLSGNMLTLKDAEGWTYWYMHVNNDTPGTDDGLNPPAFAFAPGIVAGAKVKAGQFVAFLGDSGNAETTSPHLHFEIHKPDGTVIDPWTSLRLARGMAAGVRCAYDSNPKATPSAAAGGGYYVLGSDGGIFTFGAAPFLGSVPGLNLSSKVTALRLSATRTGKGYRILGADGGIFTFGDAEFLGSVPGLGLRNVRALDLQPTQSGKGYWVLGADGGVFSFGDADFYGSLPGIGVANGRAIRLVPTPTGKGYWILGADGGVFSFGDADFFGSVPGLGLPNARVVAMTAAPGQKGYWVLAADGGVFSFGVPFHGSVPGVGLCAAPTGVQLATSATGRGYWVVGTDGSVWNFGDSGDFGDVTDLHLRISAVDLAPVPPAAPVTR